MNSFINVIFLINSIIRFPAASSRPLLLPAFVGQFDRVRRVGPDQPHGNDLTPADQIPDTASESERNGAWAHGNLRFTADHLYFFLFQSLGPPGRTIKFFSQRLS
jgi:hypothetical protein